MQFIHVHPTVWLDSVLIFFWMDAIQPRLYSELIKADPEGVWTARCHRRKHTFAVAFFRRQTVFFAPKHHFFPNPLDRGNSSSMLRYRCLLTVNQSASYATYPNCFGLKLLVAHASAWFHPQVTVAVRPRYRCQNYKICFVEQRNSCFDASVWLCGWTHLTFVSQHNPFQYFCFHSNLFLQHSGKGVLQLSCPRHDLPGKGIWTLYAREKNTEISVLLCRYIILHLGRRWHTLIENISQKSSAI